jgi:hypothetical protein
MVTNSAQPYALRVGRHAEAGPAGLPQGSACLALLPSPGGQNPLGLEAVLAVAECPPGSADSAATRLLSVLQIALRGAPRNTPDLPTTLGAILTELLLRHGGAGAGGPVASVTCIVVRQNRYHLAHAGSCRAYLCRGGFMRRLTQVRLLPAPEATGDGPGRSLIQTASGELADGDGLLICSQGIHQRVDAPALSEMLCRLHDPEAATAEIAKAASSAGGGAIALLSAGMGPALASRLRPFPGAPAAEPSPQAAVADPAPSAVPAAPTSAGGAPTAGVGPRAGASASGPAPTGASGRIVLRRPESSSRGAALAAMAFGGALFGVLAGIIVMAVVWRWMAPGVAVRASLPALANTGTSPIPVTIQFTEPGSGATGTATVNPAPVSPYGPSATVPAPQYASATYGSAAVTPPVRRFGPAGSDATQQFPSPYAAPSGPSESPPPLHLLADGMSNEVGVTLALDVRANQVLLATNQGALWTRGLGAPVPPGQPLRVPAGTVPSDVARVANGSDASVPSSHLYLISRGQIARSLPPHRIRDMASGRPVFMPALSPGDYELAWAPNGSRGNSFASFQVQGLR